MNIKLNDNELIYLYTKEPPILSYNDIVLRPLNPIRDAKHFLSLEQELFDEQGINKPLFNEEEAAAYLLGCRDNSRLIVWAVEHTESKKWLGVVWMMPVYGTGIINDMRIKIFNMYKDRYYIEILRLLIDFSFNTLDHQRICARERKNNQHAIAALNKLGFKKTEVQKQFFDRLGKVENMGVYCLLKGLRLVK